MGSVQCAIFHGYSVVGGLDDGVFLPVAAKTFSQRRSRGGVRGASGASSLEAIGDASRGAVVPGGYDSPVPDYNCGNMSSAAVRTAGRDFRDVHEVVVPGGSGANAYGVGVGVVGLGCFHPVTPLAESCS